MPNKSAHILIIGMALMLFSCSSSEFLRNGDDNGTVSVENVSFKQVNSSVHITYDLNASSEDSRYYVRLLLEMNDEGRYVIDSESIRGDVEPDVQPGQGKEIVWDVLSDFPQGLDRGQIQFAVNVRPMAQKPDRNWVYVAGAAVVLGAGISAGMMLLGNSGGGDRHTGLPSPPSRPGMQ